MSSFTPDIGIFYGYTKYEEKKITEKYIKNILSLLYDKDRKAYNEMLEYLRNEKDTTQNVKFMKNTAQSSGSSFRIHKHNILRSV